MSRRSRMSGSTMDWSRGGAIVGPARIDVSVAALARRLQRGDIAIIEAPDLDTAAAQALVRARPAAVVNVLSTLSGRYPAGGAAVIAAAGIPLIDNVGAAALTAPDGVTVTITFASTANADAIGAEASDATAFGSLEATVEVGALELEGRVMDRRTLEAALEQSRSGMSSQLSVFTAHAMDAVATDGDAILEGKGLPTPAVDLADRHVLIVGPGRDAVEQLRSLRPYLADRKPVVIAVSEAAELAASAKVRASIIIGDIDNVSDATLKSAKQVLHPAGASASATRLDALGAVSGASVESSPESVSALSAVDVALLMAHHAGARAIVTAGVDSSLLDFIVSGGPSAASTFMARLAAGPTLVDAAVLARLLRPRWSALVVAAAVGLAFLALAAALWTNVEARQWLQDLIGSVAIASRHLVHGLLRLVA